MRSGGRVGAVALVGTFLAMAPGPALAAEPVSGSDAQAIAARLADAPASARVSASCASLKRKANRSKRGSAKRRRYNRLYKRCRARARSKARNPAPTPAPLPTPSPTAPTLPAGPLYLPSVFPNPNGYRSGAGCQVGYERTYLLAGYSCQYSGYNHNLGLPGSPVWTPVYLLFGVWYCADGQFRFRC